MGRKIISLVQVSYYDLDIIIIIQNSNEFAQQISCNFYKEGNSRNPVICVIQKDHTSLYQWANGEYDFSFICTKFPSTSVQCKRKCLKTVNTYILMVDFLISRKLAIIYYLSIRLYLKIVVSLIISIFLFKSWNHVSTQKGFTITGDNCTIFLNFNEFCFIHFLTNVSLIIF